MPNLIMENEIFDLNKYRNTIDRHSKLMSNEKRKDVTFKFNESDTKIRAHKCILEAASPVFDAMFSGDYEEKDEVLIEDIRPEVFQLLLDGIYMKEVTFESTKDGDLENAADLYYAAEKYDIKDLRQIAEEFMMENASFENKTHFLLQKALLFDLPDLKDNCMTNFAQEPYGVLMRHLKLPLTDDLMSLLFDVDELAVFHEFEFYVALEIMVQNGCLQKYSKCLSKIRFLTMTIEEVLLCGLLNDSEKVAIIANIEAKLHNNEPIQPMPSHLSTAEKRNSFILISLEYCRRFWVSIMLFGSNYEKYFKIFVRYLEIPPNYIQFTKSLIETARDTLKISGSNEWEIVYTTTQNIFDVFDM